MIFCVFIVFQRMLKNAVVDVGMHDIGCLSYLSPFNTHHYVLYRHRKFKERFEVTEISKLKNRVTFGQAQQEDETTGMSPC